MSYKLPTLLLLIFALSSAVARTDDDSDSPVPVTVKPKRASLTARSLPHLIELTEDRSPIVQNARNTYDVAKLNYQNASHQWFPSLDMQTIQGLQGTDPNTRPTPYASSLDLTLTDNIYDNGASYTQWEIARRVLERAKIEFELARDQQLLNVANAYYDWSDAQKQRDILENKRDLLRRQFNILEAQYKQGLKSKRDVLRIETEIRRLELDVITADNLIDLNFQKLAAFVGLKRDDLDKEEIETEEAKPYAGIEGPDNELKPENHRLAKVYAFKEREAGLQTELVRRTYWPQIFLSGEFGYHNHDYLANTQAPGWDVNRDWDWSALVTLKYNLWDFGLRSRQVEIARVTELSVGGTDRQALLDLGTTLRDVTLQLRAFRENVKMTRELLALEQQSYSILEAEYRNGRANYLDLITNLNSLIDARSKFVDSYFGLRKQQATYAFHQGELYEKFKTK